MTPPTWSDVARDMGIAQAETDKAVAKHATLATLPPDLSADREVAIGRHLHNAYSAAERALERLVAGIDGEIPHGTRYHQDLLARAATPIAGIRPAILSDETLRDMRRLLAFRHAFRHVYETFDYDLAKPNLALAAATIPRLRDEITAFAAGLGLAPRA
ncbi:ribonuclease toxin HepT-like protein [Falsiroseomonas oryzae]|uniref:ribonuclease toxin HepT-like protein n=1 Tax=Falsiroseomonas oryzae TaxID=2766473 RepID=UPI0022EAAA84|nr:hypothetical protein [Roseomonas sp. MO-31]